jgi:hypothetical protein
MEIPTQPQGLNIMPKNLKNLGSPFFSTYMMAGYPAMERPIPETSKTKYLSGMISLCLPSPWTNYTPGQSSGPDCLYCFQDEPVPLPTWGEGGDPDRNTLHIYGAYGIHNYAEILTEYGFIHNFDAIYVADHYRAIVDLVYADIYNCDISDKDISEKLGFYTSWIIVESIGTLPESKLVLDKIAIMKPFLPKDRVYFLDLWLKKELINIENGGNF